MTEIRWALTDLAALLDRLTDEEFPAKIEPALELSLRWSGLPKNDFYRAIREALAPNATLPIPDLIAVLGRARVVPTLRERFS